MFETFYPGNYVDSAYEIPYEKLYERGYRGIIFDVDNTLVPHGAPADARAIELFERLRAIGFSTCILSKEEIQIVLKRYLEAIVLAFYRKRLKKMGQTAGDFCKK